MPDWDYVLGIGSLTKIDAEAIQNVLGLHGKTLPPNLSIHEHNYYAAIRRLENLLSELKGTDTHSLKVQICTSRLVANQVMGKWAVNDSTLFMLCAKVRALLSEFGEWEVVYDKPA